MPRKTSQSAKKDVAVSKNEGIAPRRSGRAVTTKQETTSVKDASRSRRSSTAAQTVASVADSKSPRVRSNRRESSSPSDSRSRSGLESPATRVKSTRRSTGRINYKESDGEEETPTPKYDENFESGEEFEETDSDEKSKPRGKGKQTKVSPKLQESLKTERGTRGRRGRPSKKKAEEVKTLELSDDSMEPEIVETKPAKPEIKESTRTSRGRKSKTEVVDVESEAKPKPSRRSARSSSNKEETPKKRPSRSIQAKRYTEDDEEDIEEIGGSKAEEEIDDKVDGTRKRKRESSPEETNKRVKEDENETTEKNIEEEKDTEEPVEEKIVSEKQAEEPMEVEECDSGIVSQDDSKSQEKEDISVSADDKITLDSKKEIENVSEIKDVTDNKDSSCLEKTAEISTSETKQEIESSTARDSKQSEEIKEDVKDNIPNQVIPEKECENQTAATINDQASDKPQPMDSTSESEQLPVSNKVPETNSESSKLDTEKEDLKNTESHANDISESKNCESKIESSVINVATENIVPAANAHSVTDNSDSSLNGTENLSNSVNPISVSEVPSINVEQSDSVVPKANGAHDVHESTNSIQGQCILPGRKYTLNSKLSENIRQSVKNKAFGFLSYNLGSEYNVQKEKLLHELHQLNSQIICLQQVPKPFYSSVLEPSLDALGYKGVFCQPEDSLRGMATFFKTSQFRLNEQAEISLRQLVDKELETSALEPSSKAAVKSYIKRCGNALLTHFASVIGTQTVNVLNVQIPPSDLSAHALQVSSLAREVIRINGGTNKPLLIGGEFNISENDASYQLLRDGYLSNDMIDELQRRKDIAVPEKENSSLVDLLWKSFQHPSSSLCSCYSSVLGHELLIPELKRTSSDLLWYSSDSLHTVGIVDVDSNKLGDRHFSLKADVAFSI